MSKVNKEVIRKWVDALRSGEYEQGTGQLRLGDCFCCLGVLCDLAVKEGVVSNVLTDDGLYEYDYCEEYLPASVCKWSGLWDDTPHVFLNPEKTREESISALNDDYGMTFSEIADLIERDYLQGE